MYNTNGSNYRLPEEAAKAGFKLPQDDIENSYNELRWIEVAGEKIEVLKTLKEEDDQEC